MSGREGRRGFGWVRRLPSKRWQASYVGPDMARHAAPHTFQAKSDAEAWLGAEHRLVASDNWIAPAVRRSQRQDPMTLAEYSAIWLAERSLKPRTREGYTHLLNRHLLPTFGSVGLATITATSVRSWWTQLDPRTPTVNARAYALLKAILNSAVADEELTANPCRIRGAATASRARPIQPATVAELGVIVEAMPEERRAMVLLCAWCALRIGEALELRRHDLDLDRAVVTVDRAVSWVSGGPVVGTPKSAAGRREVAIPPHVVPALQQHLAVHVARGPDALLFPAKDGSSHLQPSVVHSAWRKARATAGREDLRIHDLRHTGATLAAQAGATLAELQGRLGHSTVAAALRYQHAAQGRDAKIAAALSALATIPEESSTPPSIGGTADAQK